MFTGQMIWEIPFGFQKFYLVRSDNKYKGCDACRGWTWINTLVGGSLCEAKFEYGQAYLFFTTSNGFISWSQSTSSCSKTGPSMG